MYDMQHWIMRPGEAPRRYVAQALPMVRGTHLDTLWAAYLLCDICQERPWTTRGLWHDVVLCADCAEGEPQWEDEP
jgi:hypothetical protein